MKDGKKKWIDFKEWVSLKSHYKKKEEELELDESYIKLRSKVWKRLTNTELPFKISYTLTEKTKKHLEEVSSRISNRYEGGIDPYEEKRII